MVYGGASVGLMGAVADAALDGGGEVIGVMPRFMHDREIAHPEITRLEIVDTMHERKALMSEISDGFLALPGGYGTLDELFESLTWAQLAIHSKPIGLLNVAGFYDGLLTFLDRAVTDGLLRSGHRELVRASSDPSQLLDSMERSAPEVEAKWDSLDRI